MKLVRQLRIFPTVLRIGFSQAVAYRAEMLVWVLATTMPFIMLALWTAVAREAPVGRFGPTEFTAYFLSTFIVRQLTGSWAGWEMNFEVRQGQMSMRLLRPYPPVWSYAAENIAAIPFRVVVSLPVAALSLWTVGAAYLPKQASLWLVWAFAMLGGWLITFWANILIGTLVFYLDSSIKFMDVWLAGFFVFSGYLIPMETFPPAMKAVVDWLPFRYQIGFPVEVMTSGHSLSGALGLLWRQWLWVAVLWFSARTSWQHGVRKYSAYGG